MKDSLKNSLGVLAMVLMLVTTALAGVEVKNRITAQVDLSKVRSVTMSAEGKVSAKPDTANISFSVVTQGKDATSVQSDNDKKMKKVIDYLKSKGVAEADIKTTGYNLFPQYDYNTTKPAGEAPAIVGYSLNQQVTVKVKALDTVPSLVGGLTVNGINQIDNLSYYIDDPDTLKAKAREDAIAKAKTKAQELANNLGVKLGKIINFSEGGGSVPVPYYAETMGYGKGGGGAPSASPVEPGNQDVIVDVNLTFELK